MGPLTFAWDLGWHFVGVGGLGMVGVGDCRGGSVGGLLLGPVRIPRLPVDQTLLDPVMLQCLLRGHPDVGVPPTEKYNLYPPSKAMKTVCQT